MVASSICTKLVGTSIIWGVIFTFWGCGGGQPSTSPALPQINGLCTLATLYGLKVSVQDPPYSAKADGVTDDGPAIQKAVDFIAGQGGGTVRIPAGTYAVDPVKNNNAGIRLDSYVTLRLDSGAILQALPTSTSNHCLLKISGVHNVNISGGTLVGNRNNHTISDINESGMGIEVANSQHVVLEGVTAKDCWCDGFYISAGSQDVTLCSVVAENNRRNGMSLENVDGLVVRGSSFNKSTGMIESGVWVCGAGVAVAPNLGESVNNVQFQGCTFDSNASAGLGVVGPSIANTGKAFVTNMVIDGNFARGNGLNGGAAGIEISNTSGHQVINNALSNNIGNGLCMRNGANDNVLTGNTVIGTTAAPQPGRIGYGILLYMTSGNTLKSNTVMNSAACGIRGAYPSGANTIGSNTLSNNHPDICL